MPGPAVAPDDLATLTWGDGEGDGPLAVLLHGFPDHPHTWRHLGPALSDAGWRVVAPWLPGYPPSPLGRRDPDLDAVATTVRGLIDRHTRGPEDARTLVVGHDWGSLVAGRVAAGGGVARLVTLAVPPEAALLRGFLTDPPQLWRSRYAVGFGLPDGWRRLAGDVDGVVGGLWRAWSPDLQPDEDDLRAIVRTLAAPGAARAATSYYRALRRDLLRGRFPRRMPPTVPTLHLHGTRDGCIGPRVADAARTLPCTTVVEVAGTGHFLHLEAPAAVATAVLEHAGGPADPR
ncbi:MAG: alpha/beta fold hydrolase [Actinomycetes bacterium]